MAKPIIYRASEIPTLSDGHQYFQVRPCKHYGDDGYLDIYSKYIGDKSFKKANDYMLQGQEAAEKYMNDLKRRGAVLSKVDPKKLR